MLFLLKVMPTEKMTLVTWTKLINVNIFATKQHLWYPGSHTMCIK